MSTCGNFFVDTSRQHPLHSKFMVCVLLPTRRRKLFPRLKFLHLLKNDPPPCDLLLTFPLVKGGSGGFFLLLHVYKPGTSVKVWNRGE